MTFQSLLETSSSHRDNRRNRIRSLSSPVEIMDEPSRSSSEEQRALMAHCLGPDKRTELKYFNVIYRYDALIRGGEDLVGGGFVDYVDTYLAELTSDELGLDPENCVDNGGVISIASGRYDHVDQNQEGECDDLCPDSNEELDCVRVKGYALIAMDPQVSDFETVTGLLLENIEDIISGGELTTGADSAVQCMGFVNGGLPGYDGDDEVMLLSKEVAQVAQEPPVTEDTAAGKGGKGGAAGKGEGKGAVEVDPGVIAATKTIGLSSTGQEGTAPWVVATCLVGLLAVVGLMMTSYRRKRRSVDEKEAMADGDFNKEDADLVFVDRAEA